MLHTSWARWILAAVVGTIGTVAVACGSGDGGDSSGRGCTPGAQVSCACPGGTQGVQQCSADGKAFGACDCGSTGSSGGSSSNCGDGIKDTGEECDDGNVVNEDGCSNSCHLPKCGDGIVQAGEDCDDGNNAEFDACPADCKLDGGTTTDAGDGGNACDGKLIYAGLVAAIPSVWADNGLTSFDAGNSMCQKIAADHACEYAEVRAAEAAGELAGIANGTTAWISRMTDEMVNPATHQPDPVNGVLSKPGAGGRCNDWKYGTNHISDGEYVTFSNGTGTYMLDNDTFFDGIDTSHQTPNELQCGGITRAILCCYPKCAVP